MNRSGDNLLHTGPNEKVVRELQRQGVEFVLIGGLAVSWHCSERQADDMDLLVNCTPENSRRVVAALGNLIAEPPAIDSFARPNVKVRLNHYYYADVMTEATDGPTYADLLHDSVSGNLFNVPVAIAGKSTLIKLKEHAIEREEQDIEKHRADIAMLKASGA